MAVWFLNPVYIHPKDNVSSGWALARKNSGEGDAFASYKSGKNELYARAMQIPDDVLVHWTPDQRAWNVVPPA